MLRFALALVVALTLGAAAWSPAPAMASDQDRARSAVESGQALPLGAVLSQVRRTYQGRLLDANLSRGHGGRLIYRLRLLQRNGRVVGVTADALTGRILGARE